MDVIQSNEGGHSWFSHFLCLTAPLFLFSLFSPHLAVEKHHYVAALGLQRAACSQEPLFCGFGKQVAALVSGFKVVSSSVLTTVAQLTASAHSQRGSSSPAPWLSCSFSRDCTHARHTQIQPYLKWLQRNIQICKPWKRWSTRTHVDTRTHTYTHRLSM